MAEEQVLTHFKAQSILNNPLHSSEWLRQESLITTVGGKALNSNKE